MPTSADVVTAARGQIGVPWMHQARLPGVALDCAGLVRLSVGGRVDDPRGTSAQDLGELEASIYKAQSVVRRHG